MLTSFSPTVIYLIFLLCLCFMVLFCGNKRFHLLECGHLDFLSFSMCTGLQIGLAPVLSVCGVCMNLCMI